MNNGLSRRRGFTLIEIMITLLVLAVAMGALIQGGSQSAMAAGYLRDKTIAHWVALNRVSEIQLAAEWPSIGKEKGDREMAGQRWLWQVDTSETADESIRRLDIRVTANGGDLQAPLLRLTAFVAQSAQQATAKAGLSR
ncbi:MAG: type II secretion system minor pseudopilin GspI [Gammaproteobacteria bacterium]|nr:type II secretion system minor pseudopilin GspI [Gammaproteobacteria bacterium]